VKTILALVAALPFAFAHAANDGELWETTIQMNIPGMPAGMGARKQQVCSEKADVKKTMQKGNEKCKVTDLKESGNKTTMTMQCPEGTAVMEWNYNAARTEYTGTMKMKTKDGDMNMAMAGKKLGACDATAAKAQQEQKVAAAKQQGAAAQAQATAVVAKSNADQIAGCQTAVDQMDMRKLGMYGQCDTPQMGGLCKQMLATEHTKPVATKCMASQAEFCKRYQTMDGFMKANADEEAAKMCKVSTAQLKAAQCPQAAKGEQLAYLGRFCPVEAKPLAKAHCIGRDYTARAYTTARGKTALKPKDKYEDFCVAYMAHNSLGEERPQTHSVPTSSKEAVDAAKQGVTQGINKLKGLFGK
jgi:hypothetical protein